MGSFFRAERKNRGNAATERRDYKGDGRQGMRTTCGCRDNYIAASRRTRLTEAQLQRAGRGQYGEDSAPKAWVDLMKGFLYKCGGEVGRCRKR